MRFLSFIIPTTSKFNDLPPTIYNGPRSSLQEERPVKDKQHEFTWVVRE